MVLIEWRPEFSVGVASVDHEHQELIDLINTTYAALDQESDVEQVLDSLGEIYAKISAHFALEENIMCERQYDQYQDHKIDHERLLDDIRDIMDDFEDGLGFEHSDFAARLRDWFSGHFKTHDARLHKRLGV